MARGRAARSRVGLPEQEARPLAGKTRQLRLSDDVGTFKPGTFTLKTHHLKELKTPSLCVPTFTLVIECLAV